MSSLQLFTGRTVPLHWRILMLPEGVRWGISCFHEENTPRAGTEINKRRRSSKGTVVCVYCRDYQCS